MQPIEWSAEGMTELFVALGKAQAEMEPVRKTALNPAFRSRYANLSTVLETVLPAFAKHGLVLIQSPSSDGQNVTVETVIAHSGGGWMRSALALRPVKSDPQGLGSAVTYGRRYALMALAGDATPCSPIPPLCWPNMCRGAPGS